MEMTKLEKIVAREVPCACPLIVGRGVIHLKCDQRDARQRALSVARAVVEECVSRFQAEIERCSREGDRVGRALDFGDAQDMVRALANVERK